MHTYELLKRLTNAQAHEVRRGIDVFYAWRIPKGEKLYRFIRTSCQAGTGLQSPWWIDQTGYTKIDHVVRLARKNSEREARTGVFAGEALALLEHWAPETPGNPLDRVLCAVTTRELDAIVGSPRPQTRTRLDGTEEIRKGWTDLLQLYLVPVAEALAKHSHVERALLNVAGSWSVDGRDTKT